MDSGEGQAPLVLEGCFGSRFGLASQIESGSKSSPFSSGNKESLLALKTDNAVPEDKARALRKTGGSGKGQGRCHKPHC